MLVSAVSNQVAEGPAIIDQERVELQIQLCESQLREQEERGTQPLRARVYLEKARVFLKKGQFAKALLWAMRARGVSAELLVRDRRDRSARLEEE